MSKTVYIVTCGEYSDYRILAVFSDKETAEAYAKLDVGYDGPSVEEWDLDVPREDWGSVSLYMKKDGSCQITGVGLADAGDQRHHFWGGRPDEMFICLAGTDTERAVRRANEIRSQLIAHGCWGKNPK